MLDTYRSPPVVMDTNVLMAGACRHEIEGGWFWWSDTDTPENTAALWRMMYDCLVKERKIHNLI